MLELTYTGSKKQLCTLLSNFMFSYINVYTTKIGKHEKKKNKQSYFFPWRSGRLTTFHYHHCQLISHTVIYPSVKLNLLWPNLYCNSSWGMLFQILALLNLYDAFLRCDWGESNQASSALGSWYSMEFPGS